MNICLVTTTFYKTTEDPRFTLAIRMAREASKHSFPLIIVDGSSNTIMQDAFSRVGASVYPQSHPGMGASRRQCLHLGLETDANIIVWLEPEKHPMVPLLQPCIEYLVSKGCDVVIPRRKTFTNYPKYQQNVELQANWEAINITGRPDLDLWVGLRIMTRRAAEILASYDDRHGDNWEILFTPIITMLSKGLAIGSVTVDYIHPKEQSTEDDDAMRAKRDKQRLDLIGAMQKEADAIGFKPKLVSS